MPDLSARELDRLAARAEGQCALLESRKGGALTATVAAYCRALGCSVEWMATGQGDRPTAETVRAAVDRARNAPTTAVA